VTPSDRLALSLRVVELYRIGAFDGAHVDPDRDTTTIPGLLNVTDCVSAIERGSVSLEELERYAETIRERQRGASTLAYTCLHGAQPGRCAFAGCEHFVPDGPRDERWAFRPGTTEADIAAAMAESAAQHARAPGSASPIHMVVARWTRQRLEGYAPCRTCGGTGRVKGE
jgi:hypothetical protein